MIKFNEESFRKLKPIYGTKIDKLWKSYLLEDSDGKKEIEKIVNSLSLKSFGEKVDDNSILFTPPNKSILEGEYPVGKVIYNNKEYGTFGLREDEWVQHIAIFGRSGSGKTTLAYTLVSNLLLHKKPFLIFDWKKNYRPLVSLSEKYDIEVYTVGKRASYFHFNPLIPPPGTEPSAWLRKIIEIISKATYVGEGVMHLLLKAIDHLYNKFGVYKGQVTQYPNMDDVLEYMENYPAKGRVANWMASALRSLSSLCYGEMGKVINNRRQANLQDLLNKNVILELDSLTSTDKAFLIESLLLWIHHYRLNQSSREEFKHCTVIEEAHNILSRKIAGAKESITELLLREIRELGESIILLDQHPALISLQALGNTYSTYTFNLKTKVDVSVASNYLLLNDDDKDYLGQLEVGQAVVKLQGRCTKPFLIKVLPAPIKNKFISDNEIKELMRRYSTDSVSEGSINEKQNTNWEISDKDKCNISINENNLLLDILHFKWSGVVERYKRLNYSRRKGNQIKLNCIVSDLIHPVTIPTRSGIVVLLELTKFGRALLRSSGHSVPVPSLRHGSLEHEYWKHKIAEHYRNKGYDVTIEAAIGNGRSVDILAEKDNKKTAIEIETGKGSHKENIKKLLADEFQNIIVLCTNKEAENKILNTIKKYYQDQHIITDLCINYQQVATNSLIN